MEEFGVDFVGFEKVNMDPNLHKISIKNVDSRMGVHYNLETKTITYIGEDVVGDEGNDQEVEGGEVVPPPPTAPSSPSVVPQNLPSHILQGLLRSCFKISQGLHSPIAS